jgi:hypothetical protein
MKRILILTLLLVGLTACTTMDHGRRPAKEYVKDGKCTLHNVELTVEVQKIVYGLLALPSKYWDYHYKYFPNYQPFIMGGCFYSETFPKEGNTNVCPRCKEEYLKLKPEIEKRT